MECAGRSRDPPPPPQVLSLGRKDTARLLEVYVKRSLSVNDGRSGPRRPGAKPRHWVPLEEKTRRVRRHSSDSSAHLMPDEVDAVIAGFSVAPTEGPAPERPTLEQPAAERSASERPAGPRLESSTDAPADGPTEERPAASRRESSAEHKLNDKPPKKDAQKTKKPSILKSFLNLFSRRGSEKKSSSPERGAGSLTTLDTPSPSISCLPSHGLSSGADHASPPRRRTLRKRLSRRKFSFRSRGTDQPKKPNTLALSDTPDAVSADPTSLYYEKVSEELEKIVKEVKDSPTDERRIFDQRHESLRRKTDQEAEVIEKIINLIKKQGDAIDDELKQSDGGLNRFWQTLSYGSFQQLADLYVESGAPGPLSQGPPTAPELVKFAFSLDFTAKVAGLSSQTLGRIMGFGNQYLQDRFTQMSEAQGQSLQESQSTQAKNFSGPD